MPDVAATSAFATEGICPRCHFFSRDLTAHACQDSPEVRAVRFRRERRLSEAWPLPSAYREKTLRGYECPPGDVIARDRVGEWVRAGIAARESLVLFGPTGTGKTHIAAACARITGPRTLFVRVRRLIDARRAGIESGRGDREVMADLISSDWLFLDDVGAMRDTDYARDSIDELIEEREIRGLPIVVTLNISPSDFDERLGPRSGSRLKGMAGRWLIPVVSEDYRTGR